MTTYSESDEQEIANLLMGHSVTVAGDDLLRLDDGTGYEINIRAAVNQTTKGA